MQNIVFEFVVVQENLTVTLAVTVTVTPFVITLSWPTPLASPSANIPGLVGYLGTLCALSECKLMSIWQPHANEGEQKTKECI